MEDKAAHATEALSLICPTCGARYSLPKYVQGQRYGCKRCSASLLFGKFALQQELGRGGFGVVYKAFQADLQRIVALKFLHSDNEESTERFMREARIAANLSHPNITAIYEVGTHEGKPYITMQFVDGVTTNKATLSIREAVMVLRDAAIAVDYAHAREIIHRDLKPHNLMVTQERSGTSPSETTRRTFVMDFGLARSANKGGTLTTEGQVMGTPAFMSPEQAEGRSCDLRSDVYSLGATLYSLVTKRPPFEAPTPLQILMAVTQQDPIPPSKVNAEVDAGLEAIIMKAMAKDPAQRYPSASRLAQDLTSWLAGGVTDAGPTLHLSATPGSLRRIQGKRRGGAWIAGAAALLVAGLGGLAWQMRPGATPAPAPPISVAKPPDALLVPAPLPAAIVLLELATEPSGASVRIGNKEWRTPLRLTDRDLPPGQYDLILRYPGYEIFSERVTLTAGATPVILEKKLQREKGKVAFVLDSDPPGARILLNNKDSGTVTPRAVYEDEVNALPANVELEMQGYQTLQKRLEPDGQTVKLSLARKTGSFVVSGALPRARLLLLPASASVKNWKALAGLWSENVDSLEQALAALDPADATRAIERLKELAARGDARIRERALKFSALPPAPEALAPEKAATADARGNARFEELWSMKRYRIFATSPRATDFLSEELEPRFREETTLKAEMSVLATVSASGVRPATGQFRVISGDGGAAKLIAPGGAPVRVTAGPVSMRYLPPPGDPVLCEFTVSVNVPEAYDLAGSLYLYCGEAWEKEGKIPEAIRAYTLMLEEKSFPTSEQAERAKIPERIRLLYRGSVAEMEKAGKTLGGDLAARLEEARKKAPAESMDALIEIYAAKDALPALRGGAAASLAGRFARGGRPYEAMEWAERCVKEKVDPGEETAVALSGALKGYPGLAERWQAVAAGIEEAKKPPPEPPKEPLPPPGSPGGRVGSLAIVSATYGVYVKLDQAGEFAKGDVLEVFHGKEIVAEIVVERLLPPDQQYPAGSLRCQRGKGEILKGDEVRRKRM